MTARLMASPVWTASASRPRTNATTGSASLDPSTRNGASCRSSSLSNHLVSVESLRDRVIRWAACSVRPGERIVVVFCTVSTPRIRILHRQLLAIRTPPILSVTAMDGTKTELSVPGVKVALNGDDIRSIALATLTICFGVLIVMFGSGVLYMTILWTRNQYVSLST